MVYMRTYEPTKGAELGQRLATAQLGPDTSASLQHCPRLRYFLRTSPVEVNTVLLINSTVLRLLYLSLVNRKYTTKEEFKSRFNIRQLGETLLNA